MKRFQVSPSTVSIFCWSSAVPSVAVTSACVSPRVNTAEPWVRGSTPTSIVIGRISSKARPSSRLPRSSASSRMTFSFSSLKIALASARRSRSVVGDARRSRSASTLSTRRVVLELVLDAHRLGERAVGLRPRPRARTSSPISFFSTCGLLLAGLLRQRVDAGDDLLDRRVRVLERLDHLLLGHFLRARLDHHDRVLAAGDDQVEPAAAALLEGRVDHELAVDQADADAGDAARERERSRARAPPRRR